MGHSNSVFFHASHWLVIKPLYNLANSKFAILVYGTCYTFGMFLSEFMETFGTTRSVTSMIGSIQVGATYFVGPFAAVLVNRFGCRVIAIAGSIISATSIIISGLAPNITTLFITAGLFTGKLSSLSGLYLYILLTLLGFGFCLIFVPAITGIAAYFDKRRAIATGIASCGAGFGTFIFTPIIHFLNENFGWSCTLMIIGALVLLCIPLGLLFKPIKDDKSQQSTEPCERDDLGNMKVLGNIGCFGCISVCATKMGNGYIDLLYDARFILFTLSNMFANMGTAVAFVYTVVRTKQRTFSLKGWLIS